MFDVGQLQGIDIRQVGHDHSKIGGRDGNMHMFHHRPDRFVDVSGSIRMILREELLVNLLLLEHPRVLQDFLEAGVSCGQGQQICHRKMRKHDQQTVVVQLEDLIGRRESFQ